MKRLSDFKGEDGVKVIARLFVPIGKIAQDKSLEKKADGTVLEFASALLESHSKEVLEMFAILNETDTADFQTDGAKVLFDTMTMLSDPSLMQLFGSLRQTTASSVSASSSMDSVEA